MMLLGLLYFSIYLQYTTPSFCFSLGMLSLPLLLCYLLFVKKQKMFILFAYCKEESCLLVLQVFTVVFIVVPLLLLGVYSYLFLYYLLACLLSFFSRIEQLDYLSGLLYAFKITLCKLCVCFVPENTLDFFFDAVIDVYHQVVI